MCAYAGTTIVVRPRSRASGRHSAESGSRDRASARIPACSLRLSAGMGWRTMRVRCATASASPSVQGIRDQQLQHRRAVGLLGQHALDDHTGRRRHLAAAVSPVPSLSPGDIDIAIGPANRLDIGTKTRETYMSVRRSSLATADCFASGACLLLLRHFPRTTKFVQRHCRPQLVFSFFNACPLLRRELSCQFAKVATATHINPPSVNSSKCSS